MFGIRARLVKLSRKLERRLGYPNYERLQRLLGYPVIRQEFLSTQGYEADLANPQSLNEKLVWAKLYRRNPLLPIVTDKIRARKWVSDRIGEEHLIPIAGVVNEVASIKNLPLPESFVIKVNCQSGTNVIVKDRDSADWTRIERHFRGCVSSPYRHSMLAWWTHCFPPQILVEHLLVSPDGKHPKDYKLHMFHGKLGLFQTYNDTEVHENGHGAGTTSLYDPDGNFLDVGWYRPSGRGAGIPDSFGELVRIAEILSRDFDYMRVDLYDVRGQIYFAELTPCHAAARGRFTPREFDYELGKLWNLDLKARA